MNSLAQFAKPKQINAILCLLLFSLSILPLAWGTPASRGDCPKPEKGDTVPGLFDNSELNLATVSTKKGTEKILYVEWDATESQAFSHPVYVKDAGNVFDLIAVGKKVVKDSFDITGNPDSCSDKKKTDCSRLSQSSDSLTPEGVATINFEWTPKVKRANKAYSLILRARQHQQKKLCSNKLPVRIRVWPTGGRTPLAELKQISITSAEWQNDKLTLKGRVRPNMLLTPGERKRFFENIQNQPVIITQGKTGQGEQIGSAQPLVLKPNTAADSTQQAVSAYTYGSWEIKNIALPAAVPFSCRITIEYQSTDYRGRKATHIISGVPSNCITQ